MKTVAKTTVLGGKEGTLVTRIRTAVPMDGLLGEHTIRLGIGDDAALIAQKSGFETVVSSDQFLEDIHFIAKKHPAEVVGFKSLARAVSDLSAMGAEPQAFLLNLALPQEKTGKWMDGFLLGLRRASKAAGIALAGGDLSRSKTVHISIVVIGRVRNGYAARRDGAKTGNLIYVSGRLGLAALGLRAVLRGMARDGSRRVGGVSQLIRAHYNPPIRLGLGEWLARNRVATAMMDISDGFSTDLHRLCEASGVGARVEAARLPRPQVDLEARRRLRLSQGAELESALNGGDDYELLFTVSRNRAGRLGSVVGGVRVTCVGEITRKREMTLINDEGKVLHLTAGGWDPFQ